MKKMKRLLSLLLAVLMVMGLCSVAAFAADPVYTLNIMGLNTVKRGGNIQLTVYAEEDGEPIATPTIEWSSGNTSAATIDATTGIVTGVANGTTTITAALKVDGATVKTATKSVTVSGGDPTGLAITGTTTVKPSGTTTLTLGLDPADSDGTPTEITWTSSVPAVATVTPGTPATTATVTGVAEGDTLITVEAKVNGVPFSKSVTVTVADVYTIILFGNGGTAQSVPAPITVDPNSTPNYITLTTNPFTKPNYAFKGWATSQERANAGTVDYQNGARIYKNTITGNMTLYAVWGEPVATAITKEVNAGETVTLTFAQLATVKPSVMTGANEKIFAQLSNPSTTYGTAKLGSTTINAVGTQMNWGSTSSATAITYTAGTTPGSDVISYQVTCEGNYLYSGTITFTVKNNVINKTASAATPATFTAADFGITAASGSKVEFDMAAKTAYYYGTLAGATASTTYYKYTAVSSAISGVTFTPNSYATVGTVVEIPYVVYSSSGLKTSSGTIKITIKNECVVAYTTPVNTAVAFNSTDFVTALFGSTYYGAASYITNITFNTTSASTYGTLACSYFTGTGYTKSLASGTYLDYVTFTPNANATAGKVVEIPFSAYVNSTKYEGTVKITIGAGGTVNFTTEAGKPLTLGYSAFNAANVIPATGYTLSSIAFTSLPLATQGVLYYNYSASTLTGTAVVANTSYTAANLNYITFVPGLLATNGTKISVPYTATYTNGTYTPKVVSGTMIITIGSSTTQITYSPAAGTFKAQFYAVDFQSACTAALGVGSTLNYVQFSLPTNVNNALYYTSPLTLAQTAVKATDLFYCNPTVAQNGISSVYYTFKGFAPSSITYIGVDTAGRSFTGTVKVTPKTYFDTAKATYTTGMYKDVSESKWYGANQQGTVKSIVQMGLMKGYEDKTFKPEGNITLAEAVAMAARLHSIYNGGTGSFTQASGNNWYKVYVDYCVSKGIIKSTDFSNYGAKATRAQMAYIFANAVPTYELVAINNVTIPDVKATDNYATYIYRLYNAGVLTGYQSTAGYKDGAFAAASYITRAEVATIVTRLALPSKRVSLSF